MKKTILSVALFIIYCITANAQSVVLIEHFTETGCGACSQYDSTFNVLIKANTGKIAVINYHCFYSGDDFYKFNKGGDQRYNFYKITEGYPTAMVNGKKPSNSSAHLSYINANKINSIYNVPEKFKFQINVTPTGKGNVHSADINVTASSLINDQNKNLRLFVVAVENKINYKERYKQAAVNGINDFSNIFRAMLPDTNGIAIGVQTTGKINTAKVSYTNNDKEINFKEVQFIAFIQDINTKEVLGTVISNEHLLK